MSACDTWKYPEKYGKSVHPVLSVSMMGDNTGDGLTKDWGIIGGLLDVSVHVGHAPWGSRGTLPHPRWRISGMSLVAEITQWEDTHTISIGCPARTYLDPDTFHARLVRVAPAYLEGLGSGPGGPHFLGTLLKTVFCHGILFRYHNTVSWNNPL